MPDYPHAIESYVDRSRVFINTNDHQALVLHGTAGGSSAQNIANFFANDPNMASTHYVIGQNGEVVQVVREVDGAAGNCCLTAGHDPFWDQWGNDNMNWHTLSIEHCIPDIHNGLPLTDAQKQASFQLVSYLCQKYHIGFDHIKGHFSLDPLSRADCPGPFFPWDELFTYLRGETQMIDLSNPVVATYFQDNGHESWKCKGNGCIVQGAILKSYVTVQGLGNLNGLSDWGLPKTNEMTYADFFKYCKDNGYVAPPIKPSVPLEVRFQEFEGRFICYDPSHLYDNPPGAGSVYRVHLPQVAPIQPSDPQLQQEVATLQAQFATAQSKLKQINQLSTLM